MLSTIFSTPLPLGLCAHPTHFPSRFICPTPANYKSPSEPTLFSLLEDSDEAHSPGKHPLSPCLKSILTRLFLLRSGPCWPLLLPSQPLSPTPNQSPGMAMATEATVMVATTGPTATATGAGRKGLLNPML